MTQLFLIRHGRSTWNAEGRIQGQADPPLDDVGGDQARQLGERLLANPPIALYTSPLRRARETAEIIGARLGLSPVVDERLQEYDVGDIAGLTWEQVVTRCPGVATDWENGEEPSIPGEEGREHFRTRVLAAFEAIGSPHPGEAAGVVAHGGTLGTYLIHLLGLSVSYAPFRFDNGSLSVVQLDPLKPRILLLNDTCHLGGHP